MNYLVVGKNGSGKSYFVVHLTKNFKDQNDLNLKSNIDTYSKNTEILIDRDVQSKFFSFSENLDSLKFDNPKVYAPYQNPADLVADYSYFQKLEDGENFDDYFRFHLIYNDFIKYISISENIKLENLKPVHCLFSDINGIKIDTVRPSPEDWRNAPLGSKIFYDEFQDRPEYLFDGNKPSKNPMILELSKIRHYDIDLYLITPDPDNLHKSLRKIVHVMYFIKRPHGNPNCCSVYTFDQFLSNPRAAADSKREPKKYASYELLTYKKSIQRLYTSAANHSSMKFQIPWKWVRNAFLIVVGFTIIIAMLFKIPIFGFFVDAVKGMFGSDNNLSKLKQPTQNTTSPVATSQNQNGSAQQTNMDLSQECRKAVNVEKPECVQWFNDLSNNRSSVVSNGQVVQAVSYDPNKPYDFEYKPQVQPTDYPRMSGVLKLSNGRLQAIDQQGNYMEKVSQDDCKKWLSGYRPFNYFAQSQNQQRERSVPEQQQLNQDLSSLNTAPNVNSNQDESSRVPASRDI